MLREENFEDRFPEFVGGFEGEVIEAEVKCVEHRVVWFVSMCERREAKESRLLMCKGSGYYR
jgi:hypothetical protein